MMDYAVVVMELPEADGGGFLALVPDLYGCMSDGASPEEALKNAQEAIADWIEVSKELGRKIPEPGSAAKRAKARERSLIDTIAILSENFDDLDSRIAKVVHEIEHVRDLIENQESWSRFDLIARLDQRETERAALAS